MSLWEIYGLGAALLLLGGAGLFAWQRLPRWRQAISTAGVFVLGVLAYIASSRRSAAIDRDRRREAADEHRRQATTDLIRAHDERQVAEAEALRKRIAEDAAARLSSRPTEDEHRSASEYIESLVEEARQRGDS